MDDLGSLKLQGILHWTNNLAGTTIIAKQLVYIHLFPIVGEIKSTRYGADVQAVSAAFRALCLIDADFTLHEFADFYDAGFALKLTNPASRTALFLYGEINLDTLLLTRRQVWAGLSQSLSRYSAFQ